MTHRTRPRVAALAAAVLAMVAVSASAEEWYDAYEKGEQALRRKQADRAVAAFERAIRKRPEPGANLITYGTNRLRQYHPYVRLAEAHLLAGDPEAAREALRRSESQGEEPAAERARLVAEAEAMERAREARAQPPPPGTTPPPPAPRPAAPLPTPVPTPPPTPSPAAPTSASAPPTPTAAATGTLDLRSEPPGATALLDGRLIGVTPLRVDLAPGDYTVTLRLEGAAEQSFPIRIASGRTRRESRPLALVAPPPEITPEAAEIASLVVYSDPPGATVYLDDEPIGATDPGSGRLVKSGVEPGPHRVRLARRGHADLTRDVVVAASGPTTLRVTLDSGARPLPWPFVLVGAVVVLAAVAVLLWRGRRPADLTEAATLSGRRRVGSGRRPTVASAPTVLTPPPTAGPLATAVSGGPGERETTALPMPSRTPTVGERFGEYLLLDTLGKGGMAQVFRAERGGEHVALKRPLPAFLDDGEFRERFLREAEIGRTLHHPNIIRILERGDVSGVPYFTMELVRGETLQARVRREGAFAARAAAVVVSQVAEALDYAHLKGVVHRDLKPSNIMLLEDGTAKVMDYGIARARRFDGLTVTGAFLGTPDYVAPETAEGRGSDARSDLYSLGVVFYELLTAKKPFVGDTPFATIRKHCTEPPTPPSLVAPGVPREIETIILRLLAKSPEERYPGAEELLIELREFINRAA